MDNIDDINNAMGNKSGDDIDLDDREFVNGGMEDFLNDQSVLDVIKSAALRNLRKLEMELEEDGSSDNSETIVMESKKKVGTSSIFGMGDEADDEDADEEDLTSVVENVIDEESGSKESLLLAEEKASEKADLMVADLDEDETEELNVEKLPLDKDDSEKEEEIDEPRSESLMQSMEEDTKIKIEEDSSVELIDKNFSDSIEESDDVFVGLKKEDVEKVERVDYQKIKEIISEELLKANENNATESVRLLLSEIESIKSEMGSIIKRAIEPVIVSTQKDFETKDEGDTKKRIEMLEILINERENKLSDYLKTKEELYNLKQTLRDDRDAISKLELKEIKIEEVDMEGIRAKIGAITISVPAFIDKVAMVNASKDELLRIFEDSSSKLEMEANLSMKRGKDNLIDIVSGIERERIRLTVLIAHLSKKNQDLLDENNIFRNSDLNPLNSKEHKAALKKIEKQTETIIRLKNTKSESIPYLKRILFAIIGR